MKAGKPSSGTVGGHWRRCRRCLVDKLSTTEFFYKKLSGLQSVCISCQRDLRRNATAEVREKENAQRRARRAKNPERFRAAEAQRYRASGAKKEAVRKYRERNPDAVKASQRRYYERNKRKLIEKVLAYASKHPEKRRRYSMNAHWKRADDPKYRLHRAVSAHMAYSLNGGKMGQRWERLVGYSCDTLMRHLEREFTRGISWANYGAWHIDHILPVSSFNFTTATDADFKACWALTNLRPLLAGENISKGAKRLTLL